MTGAVRFNPIAMDSGRTGKSTLSSAFFCV